jgi:putative AlgH/UPF0301 family transcriptional regulator
MTIHSAATVQFNLQVAVRRATADVYAACIDSKVCVKVGYGNWSPGQDGVDIGQRDWGLAHSGPNFAVWEVSAA